MRTKILVIEDDPFLLPVIAGAFERGGYQVLSACEGEAGMRIFDAECPDLVVTDIVMPGQEGIATIIALKGATRPPKVIAISGGGRITGDHFLRWAKHLGADQVMAKPFRMAALVAAGRELLAQ